MQKVKIKDIAAAVGVSSATVSIVLSGKGAPGRVSALVAQKINDTARQMGYQPNMLAKSLKSGRSQIVGLAVADITNPFFGALAYHIQNHMAEHNYRVIIVNTDEATDKLSQVVSDLITRQVDGLFIVPTQQSQAVIRQCAQSKIPLVLLDRYFPDIATSSVSSDGYTATFNATNHLISKGLEYIVFISYSSELVQIQQRIKGYKDAMTQHGLFKESMVYVLDTANLASECRRVFGTMIDNQSLCQGIVTASNSVSKCVITELLSHGINIGRDIQMVSFDRSDYFDVLPHSQISYIEQPIQQIAQVAASEILKQIEGNSQQPQCYLLECSQVFI